MKFRLSAAAESDLEGIWRFIAQDDPEIASRFIREMIERFIFLGNNKLAGTCRTNLKEGMRSLPFGRYLIFYFPLNNGIEIIRVLHSARDMNSIFGRRD